MHAAVFYGAKEPLGDLLRDLQEEVLGILWAPRDCRPLELAEHVTGFFGTGVTAELEDLLPLQRAEVRGCGLERVAERLNDARVEDLGEPHNADGHLLVIGRGEEQLLMPRILLGVSPAQTSRLVQASKRGVRQGNPARANRHGPPSLKRAEDSWTDRDPTGAVYRSGQFAAVMRERRTRGLCDDRANAAVPGGLLHSGGNSVARLELVDGCVRGPARDRGRHRVPGHRWRQAPWPDRSAG
jgi:hypothetical protein